MQARLSLAVRYCKRALSGRDIKNRTNRKYIAAKLTAIFLLTGFFFLHAQTSVESHIVLSGDTTTLNIDNYTLGNIQWQEKDSLLGPWKNMPGAVNASLAIPSTFVSSEKHYRAILYNGPNGKTYLTDAIKIELRNSPAGVLPGDIYAGGHVFLKQDSFLYIIGDSIFQAPWGCHGMEIDGADDTGIGDGIQNTLDIIQHCQEDSIIAKVLHEVVYNGFDDWFLPSLDELISAVNLLSSIDQLPWHGYDPLQSSTEYDSIRLRVVTLNGDPSTLKKNQINNYGYNTYGDFPSMAVRRQQLSQDFSNSYHLSFKNRSETGQFHITFPDSNNSTVQFLFYDGLVSPGDQFEWDFQGGEILEGDSIGSYLVGYDFGGYLTVKLDQITQNGDTLHYESEPFRPKLFRKHALELPRFYWGTISTADVDKDGFEDFLLSGRDTTQLYRNLNGEDFEPIPSPFPNLDYSFSGFGDFNNDGFPDLLIGGYDRTDSVYLTKLFQNMAGIGWEEQNVMIQGLVNGFCEWTDYDRDGHADFLVSGETMDSTAYTGLFRGVGTGAFEEVPTPFEQVACSTGAFGDYNNDNFPDLVISGSRDSVRYARLYKNENGAFVETPVNILPVNNGSANWADYNNDGWLDFSVSGNKEDIVMNPYPMQNSNDYNNINSVSFRHYRNLQDGGFQPSDNGSLGNRFVKSAQEPADLDNDGYEDILIIGQSAIAVAIGGTGGGGVPVNMDKKKSRILFYKNFSTNATLSFNDRKADIPDYIRLDNSFAIPASHVFRVLTLFDFNQDGRTDILRGGARAEFPSALYTNTIYRSNTAPTAPKNLQADIVSCDSVYLYWEHASDDLTPDVALVYDLYIGTAPGTGDVLSIVNNERLQNNWFRLNRSLEKGTYYWSVRARDGARIFGEWAQEASFAIGVATPVITFDGTILTSDATEGNQWYHEQGPIPGATEPNYQPMEDGSYYCIVTDADGCVSDPSNVIDVVLTVVSEAAPWEFRVYPNPTSGQVSIESTYQGKIQIQLVAMDGKVLRTIPDVNGTTTLDLTPLPAGVYSVRLRLENGETVSYQLTKNKP